MLSQPDGFLADPPRGKGRGVLVLHPWWGLSSALFRGKEASTDVANAASFLGTRAAQSDQGLAVVGFSLGAFYALDVSAADPDRIRHVVLFYGTRPGDYSTSKAEYLGHFAENDEFEPEPEVNRLEDALRAAGRPVTFYRYPGTGHWFFEADRADAYHHGAATLAWQRTLTFLKKSLPLVCQATCASAIWKCILLQ